MGATHPVRAALFDLDGTLVDSETQTDLAIAAVMERHGHPNFSLPHVETRGRTWEHVADVIRDITSLTVPAPTLVSELLAYWNAATADVKPVPGSPEALRTAAGAGLALAVVSSSPRSVIDGFLERLGVTDIVDRDARIGGDAVGKSKPDPEGFLLAARALAVEPVDAIVFEDSRAGLLAAKSAGMRSMFITCCAADPVGDAPLATATCTDYRALPPRFWEELASGSRDFTGKSFT